jgi:alpha-glucuronidase
MVKFILYAWLILSVSYLQANDGHELWLGKVHATTVNVVCSKKSPTLSIAISVLMQGWLGDKDATIVLAIKKNKIISDGGFKLSKNSIEANTDLGILYGVFELLRRQQTNQVFQEEVSNPSYQLRILNHWDNLDGSIERGYAGQSIFWRKDDPFVVTDEDKTRWAEYAKANASIGINGAVLNNVNASPLMLSPQYLTRVKAIADVLRPYGIKTFLSIKFSSPVLLGGLKTSDPIDPAVINWWREKALEIYKQIPDFGGFLVKANSEGQPGPQDYGRTHADGANMLADVLRPYGGIVMWRAFVYNPLEKDRARQAYLEFVPLDGKFRDNVILQVKNGPVDFQPREPFNPLFGAIKKTLVMPEFQITQEYLGQSHHLAFLAPMWEECLQSDTYSLRTGSTVARCTDGSIFSQKYSAIAGVSNIGSDINWCGHHFAQANWYAFGRLAWNNKLKSDQIADEWIRMTFPSSEKNETPNANEWTLRFLQPIKQMMMESREAIVNYMMPLGLHHLFAPHEHYGPGPWWAPKNVRADWTPPYYHQADSAGIGFNRGHTGTDAVSQYHEPLTTQFNDISTCPEIYLLWFHHVSWTHQTKSGRTLWGDLCYHYDHGVKQVRHFQLIWDNAKPYVDIERFLDVQHKLRLQTQNAVLWKDACLQYFQTFHGMPIPDEIERPVNNLEDIIGMTDSR